MQNIIEKILNELDNANIHRVFELIDYFLTNSKISISDTTALNQLKKEFISGRYGADYGERLRVFIQTNITILSNDTANPNATEINKKMIKYQFNMQNKTSLLLIFVLLVITVVGVYVYNKPEKIDSPIEKFGICGFIYKWQKVKTGYDSKTSLELATKLENLAKIQADSIGNVKYRSSFSAGLQEIINANASQEIKVPDELFETSQKYCLQIQTITNIIESGVLGADTNKISQARQGLLDISLNFGKVKEQIKKDTVFIEKPIYIPEKAKNETKNEGTSEQKQFVLTIELPNNMTNAKVLINDKEIELVEVGKLRCKVFVNKGQNKITLKKDSNVCTYSKIISSDVLVSKINFTCQ